MTTTRQVNTLRTQFENAGRIVDLQGGPLYLSTLAEWCYYLRRTRELGGDKCDTVDAMMPKAKCAEFFDFMNSSYKSKYGCEEMGVSGNYDHFVPFKTSFISRPEIAVELQTVCTLYEIPEANVKLATFEAEYDCPTLFLPDWSDISLTPLSPPGNFLADHPERHLLIDNVGSFMSDPVQEQHPV